MLLSVVVGGGSGPLAKTLKANYFKMGVRNFLFFRASRHAATGLLLEYD